MFSGVGANRKGEIFQSQCKSTLWKYFATQTTQKEITPWTPLVSIQTQIA
jgi:hypothetical protein